MNLNESINNAIDKLGSYTLNESDDIEIKDYSITQNGYSNNAIVIYGQLTDGNYFIYFTETGDINIFNVPVGPIVKELYNPDTTFSFEEFKENHYVGDVTDGPSYDQICGLFK